MSQIQAVLARRCAVIGEIQQQLLRANWQKGVAEWGMLGGGVGGEWTSVVRLQYADMTVLLDVSSMQYIFTCISLLLHVIKNKGWRAWWHGSPFQQQRIRTVFVHHIKQTAAPSQ